MKKNKIYQNFKKWVYKVYGQNIDDLNEKQKKEYYKQYINIIGKWIKIEG